MATRDDDHPPDGPCSGTLTFILLVFILGTFAGLASAQCSQDLPTSASLIAARVAVANGDPDVALSPGGCMRYQRSFNLLFPRVPVLTKEEVKLGGQTVVAWDHVALPTAWPGPARSFSTGRLDADQDGFDEWRARIDREVTSPAVIGSLIAPRRERSTISISEYDPAAQVLATRRTYIFPDDGTMQVTLEEGAGTLSVVSQYSASSIIEAGHTSWPDPLEIINIQLVNPVPCPSSLTTEVMSRLVDAAANGGSCLRSSAMYAEAASLAHTVASREFRVVCENMNPNRKAGIQYDAAIDPQRPIVIYIDLADWNVATPKGRESILFHEMLHTLGWDHIVGFKTPPVPDTAWREMDRVSACNSLCYNPSPTRCECAQCRGSNNCGTCATYLPCASDKLGAYCPCQGHERWFESATECRETCSSNLACHATQCVNQPANACKP
ncbi:hypothetical protein [Rubellimicrobium arenae]|uniref:hypothetical protein n=1 Tax=Rubellimicrobium arenae TaxID=2817372 RepID=UPI001B30679D|nr:hypothetical protein [Rubellimicrobium arenae]